MSFRVIMQIIFTSLYNTIAISHADESSREFLRREKNISAWGPHRSDTERLQIFGPPLFSFAVGRICLARRSIRAGLQILTALSRTKRAPLIAYSRAWLAFVSAGTLLAGHLRAGVR